MFRHGAFPRPAEEHRERVARWQLEPTVGGAATATRKCPPPPSHTVATPSSSVSTGTADQRSTAVEPATLKEFKREPPLKSVTGSVFGGGLANSLINAHRDAPRPKAAPVVSQWEPRGSHFYKALAQEQPRRYGVRGSHAQYGGDVQCHACEIFEAVTVDPARDEARKKLDGSRGDRGFGGRDYAQAMEEQRSHGPGEGVPRGKRNFRVRDWERNDPYGPMLPGQYLRPALRADQLPPFVHADS